ncbi:MAG: TatD family hydrolase [Bacteroidota bacterium]
MKLINFHTHKPQFSANSICIVPFEVEDYATIKSNINYSTIGIHPWNTEHSDVLSWIEKLKTIANQDKIIGIGEIGLDRLKGAPLVRQIRIFESQLDIAAECNKPVIIHCVRCWVEVIAILSKAKYQKIPKAIHGFRAKPEVAKQLVDNNFYLSFGSALTHSSPELAEALTLVPKNRLFLETDDTETPIFEVYDAAADILDTTVEELVTITNQNLVSFFGAAISEPNH